MATANFIYTENFPIVAISDEQFEEFDLNFEDLKDFVADFFKPLNLVFFYPMCRSKAIRAYKSEINKINRKIDKLVNIPISKWKKEKI